MRVRGAVLITLTLCAVASAGAFLLPPAFERVPGDPLPADSAVTLGPVHADGEALFASVSVSAGWTRLGTGPFLPGDRATLVSPDGAYRVELELVPTAENEESGEEVVPGDAAESLQGQLDKAEWSRESLASGNEVRYTTILDGADAVTVAIVDSPTGMAAASVSGGAPAQRARLLLVAAAPSSDASRYRTVTADLVSSAVFSIDEPPPSPSKEVQP